MYMQLYQGQGLRRPVPSLDLNFLAPALDPRIGFTRASSGTRVNSAGLIEALGSNVPRFDYDPVTLAPKGLLIEEQRTNLLLRSQEFDNASWGKTNCTATADQATSPDGTSDADAIKLNAGVAVTTSALGLYTTTTAYFTQPSASALTAASHTAAIFVKAAAGISHVQLRVSLNANLGVAVTNGTLLVRLADGVIVDNPGGLGIVRDAGNGWWRIILPFTATAAVHHAGCWFWNSSSIPSAVGTEGLYAWGAQLEAGAFATSYIPTTTATVTRAADVASITGTAFADFFNPSEGTFAAEWTPMILGGAYAVWMASDGTTSERIVAVSDLTSHLYVLDDAVAQVNIDAGNPTVGVTSKVTSAYKTNDFAVSLNGGAAVTDTLGTLPTVNRLHLGNIHNGSAPGNLWLRRLTYYPIRLSDNQLRVLTT